jgi:hypothetical protein
VGEGHVDALLVYGPDGNTALHLPAMHASTLCLLLCYLQDACG